MKTKKVEILEKTKKYKNSLELTKIILQIKGALGNYRRSKSGLWVNSLCYMTIASFIPILAIAFSIGNWFGVSQYFIKQMAEGSPLDEKTIKMIIQATDNLLTKTRGGVIAGVGFVSLGGVLLSMFSLIEKSLNYIWKIKKTRPIARKFSDYLMVFIMLPISVLGVNILLNLKTEVFFVPKLLALVGPYLTLWLFFLVFYTVMPNRKINIIPAMWSSFVVSFLFGQSNRLLVDVQKIIIEYNKIYGSFSVLLLTLIWLKVVWFLILMGAHLTYVLQNRENLIQGEGIRKLNNKTKIKIIKIIMLEFGKEFVKNGKSIEAKELSEKLNLPKDVIEDTLDILEDLKYIVEVIEIEGDEEYDKSYRLSVNISELSLNKVEEDYNKLGQEYKLESLDRYNKEENIYTLVKNEKSEEIKLIEIPEEKEEIEKK